MMFFAVALQLDVPASQRPDFDVPRHFVCAGTNRSNEPIKIDIVIKGDERSTTFVLTPLKDSAWPRGPLTIERQSASFFKSDNSSLWYWVGTDLDLDHDKYGFGFDVRVSGAGKSAIRFSRSKYAPKLGSSEVKFDPKGAYVNDVPCQAASSESGS